MIQTVCRVMSYRAEKSIRDMILMQSEKAMSVMCKIYSIF